MAEVTVPLWSLIVVWVVIGALVAPPVLRSGMSRTFIGEPTTGERLMRLPMIPRLTVWALILFALGPFMWFWLAVVGAEDAWKALRRRWKRRTTRHGGEADAESSSPIPPIREAE